MSPEWGTVVTISYFQQLFLGKTHIKKCFFLVVGPLRYYPPYTNGLVVHTTFFLLFFSLIIVSNGFRQFFFLLQFWAKKGKFCFRTNELVKVWTKMSYFIKNIFIMQLPGEFSIYRKKWFFAQWSGGLPLPTPLVVRPLKKTLFFMCVFPKTIKRR